MTSQKAIRNGLIAKALMMQRTECCTMAGPLKK